MPKRPARSAASKPKQPPSQPAAIDSLEMDDDAYDLDETSKPVTIARRRRPIVQMASGNVSLNDAEDLLEGFTTEKTLRTWRDKQGCEAVKTGKGGVHLGDLCKWLVERERAKFQLERDAVIITDAGTVRDPKTLVTANLAADVSIKQFNLINLHKRLVPIQVIVQAVGMLISEQIPMIRNLENLGDQLAAMDDADKCRALIREKTDRICKVFNMRTLAKADELDALANGPAVFDEEEEQVGYEPRPV